jgi:hypothetical protein
MVGAKTNNTLGRVNLPGGTLSATVNSMVKIIAVEIKHNNSMGRCTGYQYNLATTDHFT